MQPWLGGSEGMDMDWQAAIGNPSSYVVKRVLRLEIPVDRFPNVSQLNFFSSFLSFSVQDFQISKSLCMYVCMDIVQFCWETIRTSRQFSETS